METKKSIGIWIRVSTEDQAKGESPEHHKKRAQLYADMKGWDVVTTYNLAGVSGKSVTEHPETRRMLKDIQEGRITGLVFSKLARLARNTRELLEISEFFKSYNADLISLEESLDTSTPAGRLLFTFISALGQFEREEIASRVAASVPIRASLGKPLGGQAPFGYQWIDKKLVIDEKEAPIRKKMYEYFLQFKRKSTVADMLNKEGYRTRNGSEFSDTTIGRLLQDPTAKGLRRANYTKSRGEKKHWDVKPKEDWIFVESPQIVSAEIWDECNHILNEQIIKSSPKPKKGTHLFTGFVFCNCGEKMHVPSNNPKYICKKCHTKIGETDLEEIYHSQLKDYFVSNDHLSNFLSQTEQRKIEVLAEIESLTQDLIPLEKRIKTLFDLYENNQIPKEGFNEQYLPIFEQKKQIEASIPHLEDELQMLSMKSNSSANIFTDARTVSEQWEEMTFDQKRITVEDITTSITISDNEITIILNKIPGIKNL